MKLHRSRHAFTLIELLTVIAIIGVLAALTAPLVTNFKKGDAMLAASRQMLDAVHRGRQLAISQHTTVYMVFAPPTLSSDPEFVNLQSNPNLTARQKTAALDVLDKQQTGYSYVSLRSVGDQPGRPTPRYLTDWQSLPDGAFIPSWKFPPSPGRVITDSASGQTYSVPPFNTANFIPFPSEDDAYHTPPLYNPPSGKYYVTLPYIAFDYLGRLTSGRDEYIPLAHGSVSPARNPVSKALLMAAPDEREFPPGNSTNSSFNIVHIDWLTGRARLERQEVK